MKTHHALNRRAACLAALAMLCTSPAQAHGGKAGDIEITHPYARPSVPGVPNGGAYIVRLENKGKLADRLLRASTPAAQRVEMHTMAMDGTVMRMREVSEIALAPGAKVEMRPGMGYHFMLIGLTKALKEGDSFPLTLEFERGGKAEVKVVVQVPKARAGEAAHEHKH
jgi:periplasmic copper chaperone A